MFNNKATPLLSSLLWSWFPTMFFLLKMFETIGNKILNPFIYMMLTHHVNWFSLKSTRVSLCFQQSWPQWPPRSGLRNQHLIDEGKKWQNANQSRCCRVLAGRWGSKLLCDLMLSYLGYVMWFLDILSIIDYMPSTGKYGPFEKTHVFCSISFIFEEAFQRRGQVGHRYIYIYMCYWKLFSDEIWIASVPDFLPRSNNYHHPPSQDENEWFLSVLDFLHMWIIWENNFVICTMEIHALPNASNATCSSLFFSLRKLCVWFSSRHFHFLKDKLWFYVKKNNLLKTNALSWKQSFFKGAKPFLESDAFLTTMPFLEQNAAMPFLENKALNGISFQRSLFVV